MKVLLLGGTGAIGRELAGLLDVGGHNVHVSTRKKRSNVGNITFVQGNAYDDAFLGQLLSSKWDAIADFMIYDTEMFRQRSSRLLSATDQYLLISTARVFAETSNQITENSSRLLDVCQDRSYVASEEYALSKARQENILRQSSASNWTIIRPYITFGTNRFQLGTLEKEGWLYRAMHGRPIVFCDAILPKFTTLTDSRDVAEMIGALIGEPRALGEDYNVTTQEAVTWNEILCCYLGVIERELKHRPRLHLVDLRTFCSMSRHPAQIIYDRMYNRRFDSTKISSIMKTSLQRQTLPSLSEKLKSNLEDGIAFGAIDWRGEAMRDRTTKTVAHLSEFHTLKQVFRYGIHRLLPNSLKR